MVETLHTFDFEAVWDDLVEQFADPLSSLRELVQNAIDANSGEVGIECEYRPADEEEDVEGRAIIHVRDWGEGMDRETIEGRLTDLFHSGKDDDYTKIGQFGIGFASVFGLEPSVVCLDTGRDGAYWRVLFDGEG
ncbi:MAG: ATP-binding protein, partial [Bradymonadaceae bacterium]